MDFILYWSINRILDGNKYGTNFMKMDGIEEKPKMSVKVRPQLNFGRQDFYPESDLAQALCEILKRKTLTKKQLDILRKYNVPVEVKEDE